ncbi:helix-turn-helix domain-containing protein [Pseudomonas sp. NMI4491_12]|uniref:helix-turn-helix domain-containing protein n=1 Tax=Pseudomonas sp. NMI4491_12 TaxID=2903146 RepID=UPI001E5F3B81|nr:helix-turn-helix domain-containing protein [Pseudomonas sp. NMI4491_12]MCE0969419.1 helix-turn-helix domain-containing protein [Pseudomonas sp. NMI4491_12]
MSSPKPDLHWAKMPNRWAMSGELANFGELNDQGNVDLVAINTSLAALKVYLAICTRANYQTGIAKTTYPELCDLVGHSRNVIARSLEALESFGYIRRDTWKTRDGSLIYVEKWLEDEGFAKIPKSWLYQGRGPKQDQSSEHKVTKLVKLKAFGFNKRISLQALKIYILLLAMRNRDYPKGDGLTVISYDNIADRTGLGRHAVSPAITLLMEMNLITFRSGNHGGNDAMDFDRTNRYLIKGLNVRYQGLTDDRSPNMPAARVPAQPKQTAV